MQGYLFLTVAIVLEAVGTAFLKLAEGFTKPWYTAGVAVCYLAAFWLLSVTIKTLPVGMAYAIWAGVGVALAQVIGVVVFKETIGWAAVGGVALIIAGVSVLHLGGGAH